MAIGSMFPQRKIKYLFIDGAYLRERIKEFDEELKELFGESGEIDYNTIRGDHQKVFYYDCLPVRKEAKSKSDYEIKKKRQENFLLNLKHLSGFRVYEGMVKGEMRQKRVDVIIAVQMLEHAINQNMQELTLIAGDDDFVPLLESINRFGIYTRLLYSNKSVSDDLICAADTSDEIDLHRAYAWKVADYKEKYILK